MFHNIHNTTHYSKGEYSTVLYCVDRLTQSSTVQVKCAYSAVNNNTLNVVLKFYNSDSQPPVHSLSNDRYSITVHYIKISVTVVEPGWASSASYQQNYNAVQTPGANSKEKFI